MQQQVLAEFSRKQERPRLGLFDADVVEAAGVPQVSNVVSHRLGLYGVPTCEPSFTSRLVPGTVTECRINRSGAEHCS